MFFLAPDAARVLLCFRRAEANAEHSEATQAVKDELLEDLAPISKQFMYCSYTTGRCFSHVRKPGMEDLSRRSSARCQRGSLFSQCRVSL